MGRSTLALGALFAIVAAACSPGVADDTSTTSAATTVATSVASTTASTSTSTTTTAADISTTTTTTPAVAPVDVETSIVYGDDPFRQTLDVYLPATEGPHPTVLGIHGGGFWARSKTDYQHIGPYLAQRGFAFVAMNYRLVPAVTYPTQVNDSFCALSWIYANATDLGFDLSRVAVTGGSAGGYLAAMLATVDDGSFHTDDCPHPPAPQDPIQAAVIHYGVFDFTDLEGMAGLHELEDFWGATAEDTPADTRLEMSPIGHVDGADPTFLLFHGDADDVVPPRQSEGFAAELETAGVDVELVILPGVGHFYETQRLDDEPMQSVIAEVEAFLGDVLAAG